MQYFKFKVFKMNEHKINRYRGIALVAVLAILGVNSHCNNAN